MGLGSVGCEILCFLAELMLGLGGSAPGKLCAFVADTLRENHFDGFVRNWVKPDGDGERGKFAVGCEDDPESRGLNVAAYAPPRRELVSISCFFFIL